MKKISVIWAKFTRLHLGLYLLFSLTMSFGSTTAFFFEKYSLIDAALLKTEWQHAINAKSKGGSYKPTAVVLENISKSLNLTKHVGVDGGMTYEAKSANLDFSFLLLLIWLLPLYRYYFSQKPQNIGRIESRIINLPLVIFFLGWVIALQRYFGNVSAYSGHYGAVPANVKIIFAV